jgi:hypothetical protein
MICEEVYSESLLPLLQIDPWEYLNHELKIYLMFRWDKITREFKTLPSQGGEGRFTRSSIWSTSATAED